MNLKKKIVIFLVVGVGVLFSVKKKPIFAITLGDDCSPSTGITIDSRDNFCHTDDLGKLYTCGPNDTVSNINDCSEDYECKNANSNPSVYEFRCMPIEDNCNNGDLKCSDDKKGWHSCASGTWNPTPTDCTTGTCYQENSTKIVCSESAAGTGDGEECYNSSTKTKSDSRCMDDNNALDCRWDNHKKGYVWKKISCTGDEKCESGRGCVVDCNKKPNFTNQSDYQLVDGGPDTICNPACSQTKNKKICTKYKIAGTQVWSARECEEGKTHWTSITGTGSEEDCKAAVTGGGGSGGGGGGGPAVETPARELLNDIDPLNESTIFGDSAKRDPGGIVTELLKYLFPLSGLLLFLMIVWGGFDMIRGASNKQTFEQGRQKMVAAIIGFILIFLAYFVMVVLEKITGFQFLRD